MNACIYHAVLRLSVDSAGLLRRRPRRLSRSGRISTASFAQEAARLRVPDLLAQWTADEQNRAETVFGALRLCAAPSFDRARVANVVRSSLIGFHFGRMGKPPP